MAQSTRALPSKTLASDSASPLVQVDWSKLVANERANVVAAPVEVTPNVGSGTSSISLTALGTAYTQNFDTLANTGTSSALPSGWYFDEVGTAANATYSAGTGSSTTGDTYSFGAAGSTDRAFGTLLSGSDTPTIGAQFTNTTGGAVGALAIAFTGEQWRLGATGRTDHLDFAISFDATSLTTGTWTSISQLNFTAPVTAGTVGALDGNAAANETAVSYSFALASALASGASFWIRWTDFNATGSDDGLGIDNFSLTAMASASTPGSFAIVAASAAESAGTIAFTVTRSGGSTGAATLDYAIAGSGANPASAADFTGGTFPTGQVSFADGQTSATINVPIFNDTLYEANETFTVTLSNATAGTIGTATATGTILNDDPAPTLSVNNVTMAEGNAGTTAFVFTVTLSAASGLATTVNYATADGTATTANNDYTAASGTLTFAPGETSKTVTVLVNGDTTFEQDETFSLVLSSPANATIATGTGTGTITNDDPAPANGSLAIDSVTHAEGNSGTTDYVFTVTRSGGSDGAVSVHYDVANGTTTDADFAGGTHPASGDLSFAAGETSKTITVSVAGDTLYEPTETFSVNLSNATGGATIATATGTGTITNDDVVPSLSVGNVTMAEGNAGTTAFAFTVTLSAASGLATTVNYATADGTATAGSDYTATSGTLTFAPGETSKIVTVLVNGDTTPERNETFTLNLSSPANATIATGSGTGTITNDDGIPATASIFTENFTGFTAAGFAPTPTAGQLDSDIWRVVGLSDNPNPAYGFTGPAGGDFGRGLVSGDPVTAGVYSPSTSNGALILQPTGAELDAGGFIEAKIQNTSGYTANSFEIVFDWAYRNNATRSDNMTLSYSTDGVNFTAVPAAAFSTPLAADNLGYVTQHEDVNISNLFVGDQGYLYLRWTHASSSGGGSRDEVGIDNVAITGGLTSTNVVSVDNPSVLEGNTGDTHLEVFTITRSGGNGTASVNYATSDGSAVAGSDYIATSGTVTFAEGETSKTVSVQIIGDTRNEANEVFYLNLTNPVNVVIPNARGTGTITNDDTGPIGIYDIQGRGITSPFTGQAVTTHGVVTAVDTNGFYLQDATGDGDNATSDGIFVFTSSAPTVVVGNEITISGTVQEFVGSTAGSASVTELTSITNITVTNQVSALPAAVLIATDGTGRAPPTQVIDDAGQQVYNPTTDGFDFYESLEGMLVTIQTPRVVANTDSFGETYVVASNGVGATGLNDRSGMTISAGDNNPETIVITRDAGVYAGYTPNHTQGDVLGNVTGVLNYQFAQYQLIVTQPVTTTIDQPVLARESTNLVGDTTHLSYASFNVENLAPVPDSSVDARNTQAKVDAAFAAHGNEVVNALKSPDIIGLQEIQDADGIGTGTDHSGTATANKLIAAIIAAGGPTYVYVEIAPTDGVTTGGEPNGYIHNGFLYNPARVSYVAGSATLIDDAAYSNSRRPLVADFTFNGQTFTAIDMHSTSRGGSDPLFGADQPPTQAGDASRTAQSQVVANYVTAGLAADPTHKYIVNGDFNGYYYEDALKTLESTDGGSGPLSNLYDKLPVQERYSYYFGGYYQAFDNILVTGGLYAGASFDVVHYNAGYTDGLSATDHDQVVGLVQLARSGGVATAVADAFATSEVLAFKGNVLSNDTGGDANTVVTAVNGVATAVGAPIRLASGAVLTLNANGTYTYNPDGAFDALNTGQTQADSFSYTLTGGSTATVTVTINGLTDTAPTAGNDTIAGTPGNDYFDLSAGGNDIVSGGAGNDGFFFGAAFTAADRVDGGSGSSDQIGLQGDYTGANALVLGANTVTNVETIALLGAFSYDITTNDANVAAGQTLSFYASELVAGTTFTFNGSAETNGSLVIYGGLGTDTITTGSGNDGIYFGRDGRFNPATDHVDGGAGSDQMALDGSYTVTISGQQVVNVETLALLDSTVATPAIYNVTLADDWTAAGETHVIYLAGVRNGATIDGSAETNGNFIIYGGLGDDIIKGGAGNDIINGGPGADTITGGAGADIFTYTAVSNSIGTSHDILIGFDPGADKIDLPFTVTAIDAAATGSASAGSLDADLTSALASLGANHAVQFTANGGDLAGHIFEVIDGNGIAGYQAGQDMVIELQSPTAPITTVTTFI